jgi:hypothetical protein
METNINLTFLCEYPKPNLAGWFPLVHHLHHNRNMYLQSIIAIQQEDRPSSSTNFYEA